MVKDTSRNLVRRTCLDDKLCEISKMEGRSVEVSDRFIVDRFFSHFIEVLSGTAQAATTWREMPESNEVTAIVTLKAGDAVLFLPGEPRLVRPAEGAELSEFTLE